MRRVSADSTRPDARHWGHSAVSKAAVDMRLRSRVISIKPRRVIGRIRIFARSARHASANASMTFARLEALRMSMKSTTMMPPMFRRRIC